MAITLKTKTKVATAKLYSQIASYLFEEEFGEFKGGNIKALQGAMNELKRLMKQ